MKCCQTNKVHRTKVSELTRLDGEQLTERDLKKGAKLSMLYKGKQWPVEFIKFEGVLLITDCINVYSNSHEIFIYHIIY